MRPASEWTQRAYDRCGVEGPQIGVKRVLEEEFAAAQADALEHAAALVFDAVADWLRVAPDDAALDGCGRVLLAELRAEAAKLRGGGEG